DRGATPPGPPVEPEPAARADGPAPGRRPAAPRHSLLPRGGGGRVRGAPHRARPSAELAGVPYAPAAKCARQSGGEPVTDRGEAGARESRATTAGACVLVVEDDDGNRLLVRR